MELFAYVYQVCAVIFIVQGVSIPLLLVVSGAAWRKQSRRLERLGEHVARSRRTRAKAREGFEQTLERLPKLQPLNCANCGAGVLLRAAETRCPNCETRAELPEDYAAATALRGQVRGLLKSAVGHWRVANVLTHPLTAWALLLMVFIEPFVLFPVTLIGSNVFPNTWIDRVLEALGEGLAFVVMGAAFLGFIIWMVLFLILRGLSTALRAKLPVVPAFADEPRGRETGACQACGGGIEYDRGDFACICGYCNVENFRVRFARRQRARADEGTAQARGALFGAMEIIEEYNGTFLFVMAILVGGCVLLTAYYAIRSL